MTAIFELLRSGQWGISHGLANFVVLAPLWYYSARRLPVLVVGAAITGWWFHREHRARKTLDVTEWYLDSQLDFLVPLAVWIAFLALRPRQEA